MKTDQALKLFDSGFWETMTYRQRAEFQLFERLLCMPFAIFHEAVEKSLNRPVYQHEFASSSIAGLQQEFLGKRKAPSFQEIIELIPEDKRILITL